MKPRVLIIRNHPESSLGRYEHWLAEAGLEPLVHPGEDGIPETLDGFDALMMLGGGLMPDDDERAPWLPTERSLVALAIEEKVPTMGICLGAQVLALVGGGEVRANYGPIERGATEITLRPEASQDPLLAGLPPAFHAIENHRDMITALPGDAVHLASSADCLYQAFRVGSHAWGVQFHPEASAANVARWDDEKILADGFDPAALRAAAEEAEPASAKATRRIADNFAAVVRSGSGA